MTKRGSGCIEGMRCPECGNHESFTVECSVRLEVTAEGTDGYSDTEWEDNSYCECNDCDACGIVAQFKEGYVAPSDQVSDGEAANLETLKRACANNDVALLRAFHQQTKQFVTLIVAVQRNGDDITFIPMAQHFVDDPYKDYIAPDDPRFDEKLAELSKYAENPNEQD